jgi:hypothetical protein
MIPYSLLAFINWRWRDFPSAPRTPESQGLVISSLEEALAQRPEPKRTPMSVTHPPFSYWINFLDAPFVHTPGRNDFFEQLFIYSPALP